MHRRVLVSPVEHGHALDQRRARIRPTQYASSGLFFWNVHDTVSWLLTQRILRAPGGAAFTAWKARARARLVTLVVGRVLSL